MASTVTIRREHLIRRCERIRAVRNDSNVTSTVQDLLLEKVAEIESRYGLEPLNLADAHTIKTKTHSQKKG